MNKKIILGLPTVYGLGTHIKNNLELIGYEVIDVSFNYSGFKYENFGQRLSNFIRKTFLRDKSYKTKLRFAAHQHLIHEKLGRIQETIDYALIIRPDAYSPKIIQLIKNKTNHLIGYQWDGMDRFPGIEKYIPLFDRFFVFDPSDVHFNGLNLPYLGNFYFTLPWINIANQPCAKGAYFVGSFNRERKTVLEAIHPIIKAAGIPTHFVLFSRKRRKAEKYNESFTLTNVICTYEENIQQVKTAGILIDITINCHKGLSLRFYEALCFGKKIITNNALVRYYDFYRPANIFIYGQDDLNTFQNFVSTPYQAVNSDIIQKYSFDNWIRYALDIAPYTAIPAPEIPVPTE